MFRVSRSIARCLRLALMLGLTACGRTDATGQEEAGQAGDAGALAATPAASPCTSGPALSEAAGAAPRTLPTTLEGTLCSSADSLWVAFEPASLEADQPAVSARYVSGAAPEGYKVALFTVAQGRLEPSLRDGQPRELALGADSPDLLLAPWPRGSTPGTVVFQLTGAAGPVQVELARPELPPHQACGGSYQALSPATPTAALPLLVEARLCNARDSLVWGVEVAAGQAVSITLENPLAIDDFRFDVYRLDVDGYEHLPVAAGTTSARLGLYSERTFSFTPKSSGKAGLLAASGVSRAEPPRLRIEQAP
jgi:hypothetical protein